MQPARPQLYLLTPRVFALEQFSEWLARVLDAVPIACVRLLDSADIDHLRRAAARLKPIVEARAVPLLIESHAELVNDCGLDGVHLRRGETKGVKALRKRLGPGVILGASAFPTRHDGMVLAEAGADYVSFGPVGAPRRAGEKQVERTLFSWWAEMITVPVVAEGFISRAVIEELSEWVDFFALGDEIWHVDNPIAALKEIAAPILT